jgi:hypothetical protein
MAAHPPTPSGACLTVIAWFGTDGQRTMNTWRSNRDYASGEYVERPAVASAARQIRTCSE